MMIRIAAAALAGGFAVAPAAADEYATYENLEVAAPADPACRVGMLVSLPSSWRSEDGAAILLTLGQQRDAARDILVSALMSEHAAVLELAPLPCGGMAREQDSLVAAALAALDAMKRTLGAGLVVAIGYGPGSAAVLDVVGEPAARQLGTSGPRYAAAVSIGDGAPAFSLGAPQPAREQAPGRLALLCRALAGVADGMGATPERATPAAASETCIATMAGERALRAIPASAAARR
jgi:hypothetical protein